MKKITSKTTLAELRGFLREDGYGHLASRAAEIKKARQAGCLLWTRERLVTTDASRINARPR